MSENLSNSLLNVSRKNSNPNPVPESFSPFEKLLEVVGSDGRFQKLLVFGFMVPLAFLYGFPAAHFILILSTPEHSCYIPGRENFMNFTDEQWLNMTIPWERGIEGQMTHSQCKMFNVSYESNETMEAAQSHLSNDTSIVIDCQYGYTYDTSVWKETGVSRYDWVCDQKTIVAHLFTLKMIGGALGTFFFAVFSDRYGRKPAFFASLFFCTVFGPALVFAPNTLVFAVFEFFYSIAFYTLYQMPFLIVMEISNEKFRSLTVISSFMACIVAVCLLPLFSWLIAEWRAMLLIYNLPMAIFFLYWRVLPESPRFLLSKSKIKEFKSVMGRIASSNGKSIDLEEFDELILEAQNEAKIKDPSATFFKSLVLAKHLILTCIILSLGYMFYVGINFNLHNMTGNTFVNFFILSFFEIPGNIIGSISSEFLGRRISSVLFEILSALTILLSTAFINNKWGLAISCGVSKMFVGGMILAVYKQVGELFPTSLRATAYGITGIVGMAATVIVPSLMVLGGSNPYLQYYILSALSALGAMASTFLPETMGLPLPQTFAEATRIGKNQSYFYLIYKGNAHKLLTQEEGKTKKEKELSPLDSEVG